MCISISIQGYNNVIWLGQQPQGNSPYPRAAEKPEVTPMKAKGIWALLSDPNVFIPPTDFSSVASSLQSVTRVCGKLTRIVNAASTSVVLTNAIRNNLPGFAGMLALGALTDAAQQAGIDPRNIVSSAIARANEIITTPLKFLENAFRARMYAQASFTTSGMADVFGALQSVSQLLTACKTLTDLLSGGVTARLGPNADNTAAGARLRAAGISISGAQIRAGLATVTAAMRRMGTLWDPNLPDYIGTPNGLVLSLQSQGLAEPAGLRQPLADVGIQLDDEDDIRLASPYAVLEALSTIKGKQLQFIIECTNCQPYRPSSILTAADLCAGELLIGQEALDNIPYGSLEHFGEQIASMGIKNRATWEQIADTLDGLDLPDIGLIDQPTFAADMASLSAYLGSGSGLFGDSTMYDFLGTAAGHSHTEAYLALSAANDTLEGTAEGKALMVALDFYEAHSESSDPLNDLAETNLIAALEAVKNSPDPVVQEAVDTADKSIIDSALQLVNEITNAVAIGYGIYTTITTLIALAEAVGAAIASTAASLGSDGGTSASTATKAMVLEAAAWPEGFFTFSKGIMAALSLVGNIVSAVADATGITALLEEMANPNTTGGQAIKAMIAESRNATTLRTLGMNVPSVDIENEAAKKRAKFGFGLTTEQQLLIADYAEGKGLGAAETQDLLFVNAYYGYQRHFFENVAGLVEGTRYKTVENQQNGTGYATRSAPTTSTASLAADGITGALAKSARSVTALAQQAAIGSGTKLA